MGRACFLIDNLRIRTAPVALGSSEAGEVIPIAMEMSVLGTISLPGLAGACASLQLTIFAGLFNRHVPLN